MAPFALAACGGAVIRARPSSRPRRRRCHWTAVSNLAVSGAPCSRRRYSARESSRSPPDSGTRRSTCRGRRARRPDASTCCTSPGAVRRAHPRELARGRRWVRLSAAGAASAGAAMSGAVARAEALDPQLLLDEIVSGTVAAASSGRSSSTTSPLSKYVVTVSLTRALATVSDPRRRGGASSARTGGAGGALARARGLRPDHRVGRRRRPGRDARGRPPRCRVRIGDDHAVGVRNADLEPTEPAPRTSRSSTSPRWTRAPAPRHSRRGPG